MIEDFRSLAVFNSVAQFGSFSGAARHLKLSTSVVSHHVSKLEAKLGVSLFFRSTRSLSLTPEGQMIRDAALRMVLAGEEAIDSLTDLTESPVGALRITLPAFGTGSPVHQGILEFARAHPMVAISLNSSDKPVDLIKEGYDLAIRLGILSDSSLKSRKIGEFRRAIVASPEYLKSRPPIKNLDDLKSCEFISFAMLADEITLTRDGESITFVPDNYRLEVDNVQAGKSAVVAGLGLQNLPLSEIETELESGALVEVLPVWRLPDLGVFTVWPDIGPQKRLTRRLIDFLATKAKSDR